MKRQHTVGKAYCHRRTQHYRIFHPVFVLSAYNERRFRESHYYRKRCGNDPESGFVYYKHAKLVKRKDNTEKSYAKQKYI